MSQAGYQPIDGSASSSKTSLLLKIAGVVVAVLLLSKIFGGSSAAPEEPATPIVVEEVVVEEVIVEATKMWPDALVTGPGIFANPVTTAATEGTEWTKVADEPCNPQLGEAYRKNGGNRTSKSPATLYFTPAVGDTPGVLSGISVDYYGYVEKNLVGSYFGDEQTAAGGTFRTLSLALRDYNKYDLCDTTAPLENIGLDKVTVAPNLIAENIPINEHDEELQTGWEEGSCMFGMGTHWAKDVVGGNHMTYEAANMVPLVPMYNFETGDLQAVFFYATDTKQTFPVDKCTYDFKNPTQPCAKGELNEWDNNPGLVQPNTGVFYACSNFCREDCNFTGSPTEQYTTMHFMFTDTSKEFCGGDKPFMSCRPEAGPGPKMEVA
jgi:hypothetical protein